MSGICLSCQLPDAELPDSYHPKCSRRIFGTAKPPEIPFETPDILTEARKMVGRMSVSGVQPKLSIALDKKKRLLTVVEKGGFIILKPQTDGFVLLPENENLCMNIADAFGIETPPHGLLPLADGRLAYIIKRFDRLEGGSKLRQEDFQQLLGQKDKYDGSYERIANFVKKHSDIPGLDLIKLFERALLFFVIGNGDAHLKNFSLIHTETAGCQLSPAYDIVNSRLVLPDEQDEMCLSIRGKKNRLDRKDFLSLASHFGLNPKQTDNIFERMVALFPEIGKMVKNSFLSQKMKDGFVEIVMRRTNRIFR